MDLDWGVLLLAGALGILGWILRDQARLIRTLGRHRAAAEADAQAARTAVVRLYQLYPLHGPDADTADAIMDAEIARYRQLYAGEWEQ